MADDLKARILDVSTIECKGVPTFDKLCLPDPVAAVLTARIDGTLEVVCPFYVSMNEGNSYSNDNQQNKGTCKASYHGNGTCTYRKIKPDSEVAQ